MASTSSDQTLSSYASTSPWEVFISFRDIDTAYKFTGHLYAALDRHGIRTFMNDPELCSGVLTSDAWRQAIQESKTYVVVFSENYASSAWCLDELEEILECCKSTGRLVVPLYYNIDPSVVHHQTGSFGEAFEKHQTSFDIDRLEKWRVALTDVKSLPGHQVCKNMSEADIINKVVDGVSPKSVDVDKYLVGLDSRIKEIASLLTSDQEDVIRIGIHGMGGVGKTTLAKAVYNQNYHHFQGSCFLENVREVLGIERGLECLQQQLINDVLKCQNIDIDNVDQGIELIRARICSLKVLIVIDDLDDPLPLEYLEGPFASGSVLIITTRNEDLLDLVKVEARYKVNELGDAESRELFSQHALADKKISSTFIEYSQEILEHAGGLPLALKVFGSKFLDQSEGGQICINKLKRASIDDVEKKLVISFDALNFLDPMLQDIFLDIACFFIGWKKEEVAKLMETCYTFVNHNIDILKKRCLLTINNRDELGMHDLLRDMGRRIASNNSPNEPGKHSRLWASKDICDVLKEHKGTEVIEGIIPQNFHYQDELEGVSFAATTFIRMSKLRFLYLGKVTLTGSFKNTFEDLRLLFWECCPLNCLPSEFHPQKLVMLSLPCSKMKTMWQLHMASEVFENLKTLNMVYSLDLMTTPDFTKLPCLEILNLEGCKSLEEVHISIGSLGRLVFLNLFGCVNLRSLPDSICNLTALNVLKVGYCNSLEALPTNLGNIKSLKELNAESLTFSRFPDSIGHLSKLVELKLSHNENLRTLPNTICNLKALKVLNISCCKSLEALPTDLGNLESLEELDAKVLTVSELPDSIGRLSKLVAMRLCYNKNLRTLPDTICSLRALEVLDINGCKSLEALPTELGNIESLKQFNAECLTVSKLPDSIGRLSKLVELRLSFNIKLETLPDTISNLRALEVLHIQNCCSLETLPIEFGNIESLKELNANGLNVRKLPDSIGNLVKLGVLRLRNNSKLESLPDSICNLRELEVLDIGYCRLEVLPSEMGNIESLKELNAEGLMVSKLPDSIGRLSTLVVLRLSDSKNLETLQDAIFNSRSLEVLTVDSCKKLGELPDQLWKITDVKKLDATGVALFKNVPGISNHTALSLKKLNLSKTVLAFLPSSMSQLSNLENLDLTDCRHLLSITKLPSNLKWIQASGCTSMIKLPNLSNLKQLEILELTDCSGLTVIQGLEDLTSIKILGLRGCNPSVIAYTFTERFFQIYSEFGHQIEIYTGVGEYPDWISYSSKLQYLDFPPYAAHNFVAMILCFEYCGDDTFYSTTVKDTSSDFAWSYNCFSSCYESLILIVPRSIFSIRNGDNRIELTTTYHEVSGVHLLYKEEVTMIDRYNSTTVNVEDEKTYPSKRLKYSESDNR